MTITLKRLISGTGNVNAYLAWNAGVGEVNPYLSASEWEEVGRQAAAFVVQLSLLHDSLKEFRLSFGPITFFGAVIPASELGTEYDEYRAGYELNGRRFVVNGSTFRELSTALGTMTIAYGHGRRAKSVEVQTNA
jgi:hypothetical protein